MKPYEEWKQLVETERDKTAHEAFWSAYFEKETEAYRAILAEKTGLVSGKHGELAARFGMTLAEFCGFIDGINTSLSSEIDLETLAEDTPLTLKIDFEKLYYNMHKAKASWLYELTEWDEILSEEKRRDIAKAYRTSGIYVREGAHVGRNDPCPCGSGKKYKNCCGKDA
ncbi:MAG TPA: SEC-C metal-binding domain-containing protein [Feifaniaceae bacterium]|nr:SEC-C metal-binding domain-containing protein [Feifaniaceae bacterium]